MEWREPCEGRCRVALGFHAHPLEYSPGECGAVLRACREPNSWRPRPLLAMAIRGNNVGCGTRWMAISGRGFDRGIMANKN